MNSYSRILAFAAIAISAAIPAAAQSVSVYANSDYDGTYVTVTGVLQYTANNCYWCSSATHTYQQTAQVTSPSGRTASCGFDYDAPAAYDQTLQCEADLLDNGEDGSYSTGDNPIITCTAVGTFSNSYVADIIQLHNSGYGLENIYTCHWIPFGSNCPGPSSQEHYTLGCGSQPYKQCRNAYNRTTGVWKYRIVCVGQPGSQGLFCN